MPHTGPMHLPPGAQVAAFLTDHAGGQIAGTLATATPFIAAAEGLLAKALVTLLFGTLSALGGWLMTRWLNRNYPDRRTRTSAPPAVAAATTPAAPSGRPPPA